MARTGHRRAGAWAAPFRHKPALAADSPLLPGTAAEWTRSRCTAWH